MALPKTRLSAAIAALFALGAGPALADRIKHPTAIFAGLDKITGRIIAFEVSIDETVQFGSLQITCGAPLGNTITSPVSSRTGAPPSGITKQVPDVTK